jgi:formate hydrogenlyase subunit 3/multisubunit Na+/H+ antiporter MnhD subunit
LATLAVLVPSVGAVGIVAARRRPQVREACTLVTAVVLLGLVSSLVPAVLRGEEIAVQGPELAAGLRLGLRVDELGLLFAMVAAGLWLVTSVYAIGYVRGNDEANQTRFFACFAVCLSSVMGLAFAADLLTFFVFYEMLTLATYPLVTHKGTPEAIRAGRRYLAYLLAGGAALLGGMGVLLDGAGTLDFAPGGFAAGALTDGELVAVAALLAVGFGSKAALMPLHAWLPAAMVAPTPVSALLHAVAVVKAGVFGVARTVGYVIGPETLERIGAAVVLASAAALTILVASIVALFQDNLKRRLAYSTVSHLSYIVLGLTLLSASGWTGGLLHLANHAVLKITLFFCAGAIYVHTHLERVSELDGIGRRMPATMAAFALAAVGLAGLPPMGGFVSKWYLVLGAADAGRPAFAVVMLLAGVLTAGYLFPIVARAFLRPLPEGAPAPRGLRGDASPLMVVPLVVTALVGLALGLGDVLAVFELAATDAAAVVGTAP